MREGNNHHPYGMGDVHVYLQSDMFRFWRTPTHGTLQAPLSRREAGLRRYCVYVQVRIGMMIRTCLGGGDATTGMQHAIRCYRIFVMLRFAAMGGTWRRYVAHVCE